MDRNHIAHYGIAGALAASIGFIGYIMPHPQKTWPDLTDQQATSVVRLIHSVAPGAVNVFCIDRDCNGISRKLRRAGKDLGVDVHTDRPIQADDGVTVGAKTQEDADKLAKAVKDGSDGLLNPTAVVSPQPPYLSFGHFVDD